MTLNIKQRFAVVGIYQTIILGIGYYFSNDWQFLIDTNNNLNTVLIATGLALILSVYISEPYFSKPVDVVTRWLAIFLFLFGLNSKGCLSLYNYWLIACAVFTSLALLLIFLHGYTKFEKYQRIAVELICKIIKARHRVHPIVFRYCHLLFSLSVSRISHINRLWIITCC
jgi:hypothetical protein